MINPILEELYRIREELSAMPREEMAALFRAKFEALKRAGHPIADIQMRSIRRRPQNASAEKDSVEPLSDQT